MSWCLIKEMDSLALALQKYRGNQAVGINSSVGLLVHKGHSQGDVQQTDGITKAGNFVRGRL